MRFLIFTIAFYLSLKGVSQTLGTFHINPIKLDFCDGIVHNYDFIFTNAEFLYKEKIYSDLKSNFYLKEKFDSLFQDSALCKKVNTELIQYGSSSLSSLPISYKISKRGKIYDVNLYINDTVFRQTLIYIINTMPDWLPATKDNRYVSSKACDYLHIASAIRSNQDFVLNDTVYIKNCISTEDSLFALPYFSYGIDSINKWIVKELFKERELKQAIKEAKLQTLYLGFMVDKNGEVKKLYFTNGIYENPNEILTALNNMPKWVPATYKNSSIHSWMNIEVHLLDKKYWPD